MRRTFITKAQLDPKLVRRIELALYLAYAAIILAIVGMVLVFMLPRWLAG
jgi:hypothetical protein